jgi:hypothetical protein
MVRREACNGPVNVVDTTALLLINALLQQTDALHVLPIEVAQDSASPNVIGVLPIELPCKWMRSVSSGRRIICCLHRRLAPLQESSTQLDDLVCVVFLRKRHMNKLLCSVTNRA